MVAEKVDAGGRGCGKWEELKGQLNERVRIHVGCKSQPMGQK